MPHYAMTLVLFFTIVKKKKKNRLREFVDCLHLHSKTPYVVTVLCRAVASLTVRVVKSSTFLIFFLKFWSIFPQTLLIFFLIFALRVGKSPTREGPGYATGAVTGWWPRDGDDVVTILSPTSGTSGSYKTVYLCHLHSYTSDFV